MPAITPAIMPKFTSLSDEFCWVGVIGWGTRFVGLSDGVIDPVGLSEAVVEPVGFSDGNVNSLSVPLYIHKEQFSNISLSFYSAVT